MTYDKTCGNVRLELHNASTGAWARITHSEAGSPIPGFSLEDLRDLRYLIDRALEAGG